MPIFYYLIPVIFFYNACKDGNPQQVIRDTTVNEKTAFNNLFLDSIQVVDFLAKHPKYQSFKGQYFQFYKARNYEYAWFDTTGIAEQAHNFRNLLNNAVATYNDSSFYDRQLMQLVKEIDDAGGAALPEQYEEAELQFTGQFFSYASKVYKGTDSNVSALGWFIPRKKVDLSNLLDSLIQYKARDENNVLAVNEQYNKLVPFLPIYYALNKQQAWNPIPMPPKSLHKGDSSAIIPAIKERLVLMKDLPAQDSSNLFDTALFLGVKAFQKRMGLTIDGAIGPKLIAELNVPIQKRIQQLLINLERLRWMPEQKEDNYILVNIPEYKMYVYENSKVKFTIDVIVGRAADSTVIFSNSLKYIIFSPYWNVPPSIVRKEILPAMNKSSTYLERHRMEKIGTSGGLPVIRQLPGASNSLGRVKFMFPNIYNIYFHDTPNHGLFSASDRSFSHGCIRLSEPKKLAQYLLRNDTAWTTKRIDSCMDLSKEKMVTLAKPVPVLIGYFTAFVDADGQLNFRKDIYKHDERMAAKLFVKN